jgi:hypothetical protein
MKASSDKINNMNELHKCVIRETRQACWKREERRWERKGRKRETERTFRSAQVGEPQYITLCRSFQYNSIQKSALTACSILNTTYSILNADSVCSSVAINWVVLLLRIQGDSGSISRSSDWLSRLKFILWVSSVPQISFFLKVEAARSFGTLVPITKLHGVTTKRPGLAVALCTRIREVLNSNLGRHTGYPDWGLSLFFSVPPSKCHIDEATTASFCILSNSS